MMTTQNTLPAAVQASCDDALLSVRFPRLVYHLPCIEKEMPSRGGTIFVAGRYDRLPTAPIPLGTSGNTPPATPLRRTDIPTKIEYYGQYSAVTQQVLIANQEDVLQENALLLGLALRETVDQLLRDTMESIASSVNCVGGQNGDLPTELAISDITDMVATLEGNDAYMFFPGAKGEDAFGTGPRRSAFIALGHTDLVRSLEQLDGYLPKWNYPAGADAQTLESEQGAVNNTRFFLSSVGSRKPNASAMGRTVYPAVVAGMEAFAKVKQDNFSSQYIYQPGYDPLRQYFTAGWTTAMATMICNDLWAALLNSTLPV